MSRQTPEQTNLIIQVSLAKVEKDLEYLIQAHSQTKDQMVKLRTDVDTLSSFFQKWKGGALVLMALGGVLTWVIDHVIKILPLVDK